MRAALLSLALLTACYSPGYRDCEVTCATSQACPNGYQCSASGFCVTNLSTTCGGGSDSGMTGDGADASTRGPWNSPRPVEFVTGSPMGLDDQPTLTDNMLLLFVHRVSGNPQTHDIWATSRASTTDPFFTPAIRSDVSSTTANEMTPEVSPNGLEIYIASNAGGTATNDIFYANRPSQTANFSVPIPVAALNTAAEESSPAISRDGLTIVFMSQRNGAPDLFLASRPTLSSSWSPPMPMTALNTMARAEWHPFLSTDKKTIYFSSDRTGDEDLYQATRPTVADSFGMPLPITELNTPGAYDGQPWVSPDDRTIFFTRAIGGVVTLMYATR